MFKNVFQSGFLSIFYSLGSQPLQIWEQHAGEGRIHIKKDSSIQSDVLELESPNLAATYVACPPDPQRTLGIKLPFLVFCVRGLPHGDRFLSLEAQVLDDRNVRRRFRASNFQALTRAKPYICTMPLRLDEGWNFLTLDLAEYVRRAYGTTYVETLRVQVHANCRVRRIFFCERACKEEELPPEFRLYVPTSAALGR